MKEKMNNYFTAMKTNEQIQKKINEILLNKKYDITAITPTPFWLKSLEIENFVNIRKVKIDFENNKIIVIEGENGIGKTLLAESITLLLNNFGRDKLNSLISREAAMRLDFEINISNCMYVHSIVIDKGKWSRLVNGMVDLTGQTEIMNYYAGIGIDKIFREVIEISDSKSYITEKEGADFKIFFMDFFNITFADKIKVDIGDSIDLNQAKINRLYGEKSGLVTDDGPNVINVKIQTIEKKLKENEGIKKEYISIVTKGSEGIVKLQNEIKKLDKEKLEKEELHDKMRIAILNKDVFQKLAEKNKELALLEKESDKVLVQKNKYQKEIETSELMILNLEKNIKLLEKIESQCEVCDSELSIIKKQLILKGKKEKIESIIKSCELGYENLKKVKSIDVSPVQDIIDEYTEGVNHLARINIKNQKGLNFILEKYNVDDIQKELENIIKQIFEKQEQADKLTENNPAKRKAELESQLEGEGLLKSDLAIWSEKKKNYENQKDKIEEVNKKIKIAEFQDNILNQVFDIFDKNKQSSFPIWYLNSSIRQIETEVNQELDKFKKLGLKLKIGSEFEIAVKGLTKKLLSGSELKIVNFIFKLVIAKTRFKEIPLMIIDDYQACLEKNTLKNLAEVINYYIEKKYLSNLILTHPTESEEIVINGMKEI